MRAVEKFRLNKQHVAIIVLAAVLLLFIIGSLILNYVLAPIVEANKDKPESIELIEGEDYYLSRPVAYPQFSSSQITYVNVHNDEGAYELVRSSKTGILNLFYIDSLGNEKFYAPPVLSAEGIDTYPDLYAVTGSDSMLAGTPVLTNLCVAIGSLYFTERIALPEDEKERANALRAYGFDTSNIRSVLVSYVTEDRTAEPDENGKYPEKEVDHAIIIGGQPISGIGHYFMVDNREGYVYYTASDYLDYALFGVEEYVKGNLIGKSAGSQYAFLAPMLTTDFRLWKNTVHKTVDETVTRGANVITTASAMIPRNEGADYVLPEGASQDGYILETLGIMKFDLSGALSDHPDLARFRKMLEGKAKVGEYGEKLTDRLYLTMLSPLAEGGTSKFIDFKDKNSLTYTYTVTKLESVITDTEELVREGTPVSEGALLKVSFVYKIDGETASGTLHHAVVDPTDELIPAEARERLLSLTVGELSADERITFDVTYTKENATSYADILIIKDIVGIYDKKGNPIETVTEDSYVTITYYEYVQGKATESRTVTVDMSASPEGERDLGVRQALLGKSEIGENGVVAYSHVGYYEIMREFVSYAIKSVDSFVTNDPVVSFRFLNASERDPFFGESYYRNTMESAEMLYGINASVCESLVEYLGGMQSGNSSEGLSGKTVHLGLDAAAMEEYGLYANTVYFEIPRGIVPVLDLEEETDPDEADKVGDFKWMGTVAFTLYISDPQYDEDGQRFRYVGSDMYDLVAAVYDEELDFVDQSFEDLWARKNIVLIDVMESLDELILEFNMEDVYGTYKFDYYTGKVLGPDGETMVDIPYVDVYASGSKESRMDTVLEKYLVNNRKVYSLTALYQKEYEEGNNLVLDADGKSLGVSNFAEAFLTLQYTRYEGSVSEEEQREFLASDPTPLMTLHLKLNQSAGYYTCRFYRLSDRRVLVSVYTTAANGASSSDRASSFYITTFAFKKLVSNFVGLLNADLLDQEVGYYDER